MFDSKGRKVIDVEFEFGNEPEDAFITSAIYEDDGTDVGEKELDYLQDAYADTLYEAWLERGIAGGDCLYDQWKDDQAT